MGTRKVPPSQLPHDERVDLEVPYLLWYCQSFPVHMIGGKLDKDPQEKPWIQGLYDDLRETKRLRNPVIIWNHHEGRLSGKQPKWLLRAGSNRMWCIEQLDWYAVPAIVSTAPSEMPTVTSLPIHPRQIQAYFQDGGNIWANEHGFGLLAAKKPEETYAKITQTTLRATHWYDRNKIINPLLD